MRVNRLTYPRSQEKTNCNFRNKSILQRTHPVLDAVATSASVAGTQASSADVDLLYRVESAPFVGDRLPVTSNTLKTKPYVSRLCEFL